ncbi:MAG TPA: hypothetical protein V6D16_01535 [Candidatus Obscuribacterales bacterium]
MVRIKGENSDYKYVAATGQIHEVQPTPEQLYLQLFICPYDHPSRVEAHEAETDCCVGTDSDCPHNQSSETVTGHALIRLDEKTGISLVAGDRNQIILDQSGKILLCPSDTGQVEIHGNLTLHHPNLPQVSLDISERGITLQSPSGAHIHLDPQGNIDLTPAPQGHVRIHGNLEVTGTIHSKNLTHNTRPPHVSPSPLL